jgi:uncharacterized protein YbjT (DUF2867 family)
MEQGIPVRAFVHNLDSRSDELRKQGAEVVEGDLLSPASVQAAMRNIERAYFTYPVAEGLLEAATIFATAARDAGLELVVNNSQLQGTPGDSAYRDLQRAPSFRNLQHRLADRIFDWAQVRAVHLQAPPSNEDIARVATAVLMDPARHAGKSYRPTGPELVGAEDMAKAIGRAVGRSVRAVPTPTWLFMKAARTAGLPIDLINNLRYYLDDHRRGAFELSAPTTDVLDVTGRSPEDFETIARRYAALPRNRRTFGNWLRQFAQLMIAPLSPGFNFDRYDRELRRPFPSEPQFASESKLWRREHGMTDPARRAASV